MSRNAPARIRPPMGVGIKKPVTGGIDVHAPRFVIGLYSRVPRIGPTRDSETVSWPCDVAVITHSSA